MDRPDQLCGEMHLVNYVYTMYGFENPSHREIYDTALMSPLSSSARHLHMFHLVAFVNSRTLARDERSGNPLFLIIQLAESLDTTNVGFIIGSIATNRSQGRVVAAVREPAD